MEHSQTAAARSVFVGREPEIGGLLAGLEEARAGRGRFLALVGEAGIGKTRTLEEFVDRAGVPEARLLWGRCPEHHGLPAYWPWTQAIEGWIERCDAAVLPRALGRGAADLAQIVPGIAERLETVESHPVSDAAQARLRLFDSMAAFLRRAAESEPLVLVLDDLHWADEGSVLLLAFLAPELRRSRTLLLATYREREMKRSPRLLAEVARVGERIPLRGLALAEAEAFIRDRLDGARQALVAHLHRISQGNPFFLDELVRMLRLEGRVEEDESELGTHLPDEVREVIRRNLEPIAAEDRALLTTAAVIGYDFDVARLGAVSELPPDRLLERLETAAEAGVVEEIHGASGHFRFAHMLIRDAFYGELSPLDRARLHSKVGLALEELHQGARDKPCAELARHFVPAAVLGDAGKALEYAAGAGAQALSRFAHEEAVGHFEVALKVLRLGRPDERRELELRMSLAQAQAYAGDHPRARATYERAAERARSIGDAATLARAALGYSLAAPGVGAVYPTLVAMLEEALRMLGEADGALRATVLGSLASALYFSPDERRREELSVEAVAMARRVGERGALARALVQRHHVLWRPEGSLADRLALCEELIEVATSVGDRQLALHGQLWRIVDLLDQGDLAALDAHLEGYARQAHRRASRSTAGSRRSRARRGCSSTGGSPSGARGGGSGALAGGCALPLRADPRCNGSWSTLETGTSRPWKRPLPGWRRRIRRSRWGAGLTLILAEIGRIEEARALFDGFSARGFGALPRDANRLSSLASFALVAHSLCDGERAAVVYDALLPYAERNASVGFAAGTFGACARYLGLLAATRGRLDDAARHLADALAANTRLGSRPLVAHTQCDLARVLLLRQERSRADDLLAEARRTAEQLGLIRLLARIDESRAGSSGSQPRTVAAAFRRDGSHWVVTYEGRSLRMKHVKGHDYLVALLQSPGRDIHALDLGAERTVAPVAGVGLHDQVRRDVGGDAGDVIDPQARAAYKRRLAGSRRSSWRRRAANDSGSSRAPPGRDRSDHPGAIAGPRPGRPSPQGGVRRRACAGERLAGDRRGGEEDRRGPSGARGASRRAGPHRDLLLLHARSGGRGRVEVLSRSHGMHIVQLALDEHRSARLGCTLFSSI
jgi:tetratricopeptide (TPR) repeat protein